jgi:hypothetical protein
MLALALSGCGSRVAPTAAVTTEPPPPQTSPQSTLRLLEWSYNHQSLEYYRRLFTADFRFVFSDLDTSGAVYRAVPWTREDELISTAHLFADAADVLLTLDRNFGLSADTRPGKDPRWHKTITTQLFLRVQLEDGHAENVTGSAKFYFVRGDSALIPDDLQAPPDSTVWYIDRWEDLTAQGGSSGLRRPSVSPSRALPSRSTTWGWLKVFFR